MASTEGSTRPDLMREKLTANAGRYNFYQLVELLQQRSGKNFLLLSDDCGEEVTRFRSSASIAFPSRDVISLEHTGDDHWQLTTSFMGMHGSQSPLPGYYLDGLAWEEAQQSNQLTDFLNLFNHRLLTLLHRVWRKYRYYICFENEGKDDFSQRMFALVGLGNSYIRNQLQINHSKMLAYAGLLATPGRSPDVICGLIAHCFGLEDVTLDSWQLHYVSIVPEQQNRLGESQRLSGKRVIAKSIIGENFTLGARVPDRGGKFRLNINRLSRKRFLDFLPNGDSYRPLAMFMSFILRDQYAWDMRLGIATKQVGGMTLGVEQNSLLGWTCFLGRPANEPEVIISVRE